MRTDIEHRIKTHEMDRSLLEDVSISNLNERVIKVQDSLSKVVLVFALQFAFKAFMALFS